MAWGHDPNKTNPEILCYLPITVADHLFMNLNKDMRILKDAQCRLQEEMLCFNKPLN